MHLTSKTFICLARTNLYCIFYIFYKIASRRRLCKTDELTPPSTLLTPSDFLHLCMNKWVCSAPSVGCFLFRFGALPLRYNFLLPSQSGICKVLLVYYIPPETMFCKHLFYIGKTIASVLQWASTQSHCNNISSSWREKTSSKAPLEYSICNESCNDTTFVPQINNIVFCKKNILNQENN